MARRPRRRHVHDLAWHEAQAATPWLDYWDMDRERYMTEREYHKRLDGKRAQMEMHDRQPVRLRQLVGEHGVKRGQEIYHAETLASIERCHHGRPARSCAQCTYDAAIKQRAATRDGTEVTRKPVVPAWKRDA